MSDERREELLARIEQWTAWPQTALALLLIPLLLSPHLVALSAATRATLDTLDYLIWGFFVAELAVCLAVAPRRRHYLRTHWFDVVLVVLPMLRPLRALRSFRALWALTAAERVLVGLRQIAGRRGLHYVLATALVVVLVAGSLVTIAERQAEDATIRSLPDGLWWATATITTVGYGDTFPKTDLGRGIGVALMLIGIGLFGAITANLAAFFVEQRGDALGDELKVVNERLARIERAIADPSREAAS